MFNDDLKQLWGLHPLQEAYFNTLKAENPNLVPARVISTSHEQYRIMVLGIEEEKFARVRGSIYHQGVDLPAVGDWVVVEITEGDHQFLPIAGILPRTSELKRSDTQRGFQTLVANADFIGLVTSFNQDLNERRLERGLAMIEESRATPLIIVNKSDLLSESELEKWMTDLSLRFADITILSCSAHSGDGVLRVKALFGPGKSVAFLGMSGVGKSTLINAMLGKEVLATNQIREDDSRGRHTTTHREMFLSDGGFWVIDSPGIREFSVFGDESVLESTFDDVASLMLQCRFSDCSHGGEPGCRIGEALESGDLAQDRWDNFLKMRRELEFHANKNNKSYHSEKRKMWAKRSMQLRQKLKSKGKK